MRRPLGPMMFDVDLLAADAPRKGNKWLVCSLRPAKGQLYLIRAIAPYAMERINVGALTESVRFILPQNGNGWFSFEATVDGGAAVLMESDLTSKRNAAGPLTHNDRWKSNGFTTLSLSPVAEAFNMLQTGIYNIKVPGGRPFEVTFALAQAAFAAGISEPYTVAVGAVRRVDFAGVVIVGEVVPEQEYVEPA